MCGLAAGPWRTTSPDNGNMGLQRMSGARRTRGAKRRAMPFCPFIGVCWQSMEILRSQQYRGWAPAAHPIGPFLHCRESTESSISTYLISTYVMYKAYFCTCSVPSSVRYSGTSLHSSRLPHAQLGIPEIDKRGQEPPGKACLS